jgi:protein-tyrosine phosphatase
MGYVDLHLHLLPGIDDGSRSLDETLAMARALSTIGFTDLAPSPHCRSEFQSYALDVRLAAFELASSAISAAGIAVTLSPNAEHYFLEETFPEAVATKQVRTIGYGNCVLVEAPYVGPVPALHEKIFRMKLKGLTPLIAHPERCYEFEKRGRADEAVQAGALLQLDIGALIGRYGRLAQKLSQRWLDGGLYAVAATDLHSPVNAEAWITESIEALRKHVGSSACEALLRETPGRILRGEPV